MNHIKNCIAGVLVLGLIPVSVPALELALEGRSANTWGEKLSIVSGSEDGERPAEGRFNRRDCLDKETVGFTFDLSVEGAEGPVMLYAGKVCGESTAKSGCSVYEIPRSGQYTFTLEELFGADMACSGTGEEKIWLAEDRSPGVGEPLLGLDAPYVLVFYDMDPPAPPVPTAILPGNAMVTLEWTSAAPVVDIVYHPGSQSPPTVDTGAGADAGESADTGTDTGTGGADDTAVDTGTGGADDTTVDTGAGDTADTALDTETLGARSLSVAAAALANEVDCASGGFSEGDEYTPEGDYGVSKGHRQKSGVVDNLEDRKTYKFGLVAKDDYLNRSPISRTVCAVASQGDDFWKFYSEGGGKGGKFCFVATQAFGSYDHPVVQLLRAFRDRFLEPVPGGARLIRAYYDVGPELASVVERDYALKTFMKGALTVVAVLTIPLTLLGPFGTVLALSLWIGVAGYRRRRRQQPRNTPKER